jgi:hypothetical protein
MKSHASSRSITPAPPYVDLEGIEPSSRETHILQILTAYPV